MNGKPITQQQAMGYICKCGGHGSPLQGTRKTVVSQVDDRHKMGTCELKGQNQIHELRDPNHTELSDIVSTQHCFSHPLLQDLHLCTILLVSLFLAYLLSLTSRITSHNQT